MLIRPLLFRESARIRSRLGCAGLDALKLCDVWRFEGGSATTLTSYFDTGSLMTQLGLMPEATAAQA